MLAQADRPGTARPAPALRPEDLAWCRRLLARGSRSFSAAARLLPREVRAPTTVLYAFLRVADDLVDEGHPGDGALEALGARLDRVWAGTPDDDPVDRALAAVVARHQLPRGPFDALLEGFAWDRDGRRYPTLADTLDYGVRVAGTVGVLMAWLMGVRRAAVLARACDLGVAMQLTNIARDVAEDAERGRVYLPEAWLGEEAAGAASAGDPGDDGRPPLGSLFGPAGATPAVRAAVDRLLGTAARLYRRGDDGLSHLPRRVRPAIRAARLIYADIGRVLASQGHDPSRRAVTGGARKLWLALRALPAWLWRPRPVSGPWIPGADRAMGLGTGDGADAPGAAWTLGEPSRTLRSGPGQPGASEAPSAWGGGALGGAPRAPDADREGDRP